MKKVSLMWTPSDSDSDSDDTVHLGDDSTAVLESNPDTTFEADFEPLPSEDDTRQETSEPQLSTEPQETISPDMPPGSDDSVPTMFDDQREENSQRDQNVKLCGADSPVLVRPKNQQEETPDHARSVHPCLTGNAKKISNLITMKLLVVKPPRFLLDQETNKKKTPAM